MLVKSKIYSAMRKAIFSLDSRRENLDIFLSVVLVAGIYTVMSKWNFIPDGLLRANLSPEFNIVIGWVVALGILTFFICLIIYLLKVAIRGLAATYSLFKKRRFAAATVYLASAAVTPIYLYYCYKVMLSGKLCPHGWECNPGFMGSSNALPYVSVCVALMCLVWLMEINKNAAN
jgi:hypothetical protein